MNMFHISKYRDEIYGFAILWIMLFHAIDILGLSYAGRFPFLSPINTFLSYGNIGCDIFLFISGISLYFSFQKCNDTFKFIKNRFLKLFIPVLLIDGLYWIITAGVIQGNIPKVLVKLSMLEFWVSGNQQIWFVSTILIFYLLFPFIYGILFHKEKGRGLRCLILICFVVIFTFCLSISYLEYYNQIEIGLTRLPIFIFGCLIGKAVYEKKKLPVWSLIIAGIVLVLGAVLLEMKIFHGIWIRYSYFFISLALCIILVLLFEKVKLRFIHICFCFLGKISLNLYLAHILMIHLYRYTGFYQNRRLFHYLLLIIIAIALAWISNQIEKAIRKKLAAATVKSRL